MEHGGKVCEPHQLKENAQCNVHKCLSAGKCDAKHVTCSIHDKLSHNRGKYGKAFEDSGEDYESCTMKIELQARHHLTARCAKHSSAHIPSGRTCSRGRRPRDR